LHTINSQFKNELIEKLILGETMKFMMSVIGLIIFVGVGYAQQLYEYKNPEEAGFSTQKLESVKQLYNESEASALIVLYDGKVVLSLGEVTRRFRIASMRKSILSALYGRAVEDGKINLNSTLADLGIEDEPKLTESEKQANVKNLLTASSGVYHLSAYMPRGMEDRMPERGSADPGEKWFYNNWDFNTLVTIYNQQTGKDFFDSFKEEIANPIGMQDFSLHNTYYLYENEYSIHPAYLMRMSARDLARFGQLYLNEGKWYGEQIIPKDWVEESTSSFINDTRSFKYFNSGYGYLWWTADGFINSHVYYANGAGGQRVFVLPEENMVVVHLVDTYKKNFIANEDEVIFSLLKTVVESRTSEASQNPELVLFTPQMASKPTAIPLSQKVLEKYTGQYNNSFLGTFDISLEGDMLLLTAVIGKFYLIPISKNEFIPEDIDLPAEFIQSNESDKTNTIEAIVNENRELQKFIFYYQ
jgi:CubicO group peptidase (beta-lactamase class C family)